MVDYLRGVIVDMALNFGPLDSLKATLAELCRERKHHSNLLQGLQDLATHSSFQVRRYVAILLAVRLRHECTGWVRGRLLLVFCRFR